MFSAIWRGSKFFFSLFSSSSVLSIHKSNLKHQDHHLPRPSLNSARSDLIPGPKICFPISPAKTKKSKNKHTYLFTSLKSVLIVSHLASYCSFSRDWRREPSPVLVGLATRLSVVWCSLEFTSFQPEVDLSANIVVNILGITKSQWFACGCVCIISLRRSLKSRQVAFEMILPCISGSR